VLAPPARHPTLRESQPSELRTLAKGPLRRATAAPDATRPSVRDPLVNSPREGDERTHLRECACLV